MTREGDRRIYERLGTDGGFVELAGRAFFRMTGADRVRYLNGQITQSVEGLGAGEARHACALDARGGIVTELLFRAGDGCWLIDVPEDVREIAFARLERYMIADDVAIEDCTGEFAMVHVLCRAPAAAALPPSARVDKANRFGLPGWDVLAPASERDALLAALESAGVPALSRSLIDGLRIERGMPAWGSEILAGTLPHEAGIAERAVSFTKGCYIGQEVVSRIQSVGSPSRQLRLVAPVGDAPPPAPGDELRPHGEPAAKPCGTVTSAAHSFALDKTVALAYLKRGFHETGVLVDAKTPGSDMPARPAEIINPAAS